MFTGIITDQGTVLQMEQAGDLRVRIGTNYNVSGIDLGASIACDGVCLTVVDLGDTPQNWFDVQVSAETVSKTNLDTWAVGRTVNLERAAAGDLRRFDRVIVSYDDMTDPPKDTTCSSVQRPRLTSFSINASEFSTAGSPDGDCGYG